MDIDGFSNLNLIEFYRLLLSQRGSSLPIVENVLLKFNRDEAPFVAMRMTSTGSLG